MCIQYAYMYNSTMYLYAIAKFTCVIALITLKGL